MAFFQGPIEYTHDDRNRVVLGGRGKVERVEPGGDVLLTELDNRQSRADGGDEALQISLALVEGGLDVVLLALSKVDV